MTRRLSEGIATPNATVYLQADVLGTPDAVNNRSVLRCYLEAINNGTTQARYTWNDATVTAYINGTPVSISGGSANLAQGTSTGGTFWLHGPWDITVPHNPDGSKTVVLRLVVSYPQVASPGDTGGDVSTTLGLTTLRVPPTAPTGVTATRLSDSLFRAAWTNTGASNGQASQNTVETRVNGGAFDNATTIAATDSLSIACSPNQKIDTRVRASNSAGTSGWAQAIDAIYTTPGAPTTVAASKDANQDVTTTWVPTVAFVEHVHVVEHGTVVGGVTTWDGSPLAEVAAGASSYKHVAPDPSKVHVYRISAKNTDTAALTSAGVVSNEVQLLVAPGKPTLSVLGPNIDRGKALVVPWVHNSVDTTPQSAYEFARSIDGGTTWTSSGKQTSALSEHTIAANAYAANVVVAMRMRTWGQASSGGADGTGASPWSDVQTVTFKTRPVATITQPLNGGVWPEASLDVRLGFAQAQGATFVRATIVLSDANGVIETKISTTLTSTRLDARVRDGESYTISVTVLDSNGLVSDATVAAFAVAYTQPVAAEVSIAYLRELGTAQLNLTFPAPGAGEVAAVAFTVTRTIDGVTETVLEAHPISGSTETVNDVTVSLRAVNEYEVRTISADGATTDTDAELETAEEMWAFLSTGPGFSRIVSFFGDLQYSVKVGRASALVEADQRTEPIALFGAQRSLAVSGSATILPGEGSTPQEIEKFLENAEIVCYRDPSGRRMFGQVTGDLDAPSSLSSGFTYTVTRAS